MLTRVTHRSFANGCPFDLFMQAGELYVFGLLSWALLRPGTITTLESTAACMSCCTRWSSFVMMPGAGSLPVHSAHSHGTYHSGEGSTSGFKLPDVSGLYASVTQVLARVQSRTPWHNRGSGSSTAAVVTGQSGSERQPLLPEGQRLGGKYLTAVEFHQPKVFRLIITHLLIVLCHAKHALLFMSLCHRDCCVG